MPQTAVGYRQPSAIGEGQIATTSIRRLEGVMINAPNGMAGILPFGRVIVRNAQGKAVLPTAAATAAAPILGISLLNEKWGIPLADLTANPGSIQTSAIVGYPAGANVLVDYMQMGDIWVYTEEAVNPNDLVAYRYDTASRAGSQLGQFRKGFTGAAAGEQAGCELLPNARFISKTSGAGLAIVRIGVLGQSSDAGTAIAY